jgi:hypothetical protein
MKHMGKMRNEHRILGGEPEGKRTLRGIGRVWENNIKSIRNRVERCDSIDLVQDRGQWWVLVNVVA